MTRLGTVRIGDDDGAVLFARAKLERLADLLGVPETARARLAVAVSEIGRALGRFEEGGALEIAWSQNDARLAITARPPLPPPCAKRVQALLGPTGGVAELTGRTLVQVALPPAAAQSTAALSDLEKVVTEPSRDELFERLEQRNRELERMSRLKSQFLAGVSHELRTPMNAIIGFTGMVLRKAGDDLPAKQRRNLETVLRNAKRLLEMINSLLDYAKIEAGRMQVTTERFAIGGLLQDVAELIAPLAEEKGLAFEVECAADVEIETDRGKLRQVLVNLLGNAVKFTERGRVLLRCEPDGSAAIRLIVADTGPGIPEEALPTIFEPFRQADGSDTKKAGGTGLGLAIVKQMLRLIGGAIEVESAPGTGTRFTASVPLRPPDGAAERRNAHGKEVEASWET